MIDVHSHILPGLDDGSSNWEDSLQMARMAVEDGIHTMVASPHLFQRRSINLAEINHKDDILDKIDEFKQKLLTEAIELEILPGCDFPLSFEGLQLLDEDRVLTINDGKHYLLLEFPDSSLPPASEDICFRLQFQGYHPHHHPSRAPLHFPGDAREVAAIPGFGLPGATHRRQLNRRFRTPGGPGGPENDAERLYATSWPAMPTTPGDARPCWERP